MVYSSRRGISSTHKSDVVSSKRMIPKNMVSTVKMGNQVGLTVHDGRYTLHRHVHNQICFLWHLILGVNTNETPYLSATRLGINAFAVSTLTMLERRRNMNQEEVPSCTAILKNSILYQRS